MGTRLRDPCVNWRFAKGSERGTPTAVVLLGQGILQILDNQQEGLFHDSEQLHRLLVVVGGVNSVKKNISESATGFQGK